MNMPNGVRLCILLTVASGVAWVLFYFINTELLSHSRYAQGIDLVYLPAGVRVGLVLTCRVWGALGIALANPLLFSIEFPERPLYEALLNSLIAGFVPFATILVAMRLMRIDSNLNSFKAIHLPVLSLAASLLTPMSFNLFFVAFDYKREGEFWANFSAMVVGDFLGCLFVLVALWTIVKFYRMIR